MKLWKISIKLPLWKCECTILGQSYNANDTINADIGNTIHPKFSEFRMKVKQTFLLQITNEKFQNMQRIENTRLFSSRVETQISQILTIVVHRIKINFCNAVWYGGPNQMACSHRWPYSRIPLKKSH